MLRLSGKLGAFALLCRNFVLCILSYLTKGSRLLRGREGGDVAEAFFCLFIFECCQKSLEEEKSVV